MKKFLAIAALALSLGACAELKNAWDVVTTATVSPTLVVVAANSFDAVEATATQYLKLPKCVKGTASAPGICRSRSGTAMLIPAIKSGREARDELLQFMQDHPGQLGPKGAYDALIGATGSLKAIMAQYNIGASSK